MKVVVEVEEGEVEEEGEMFETVLHFVQIIELPFHPRIGIAFPEA